MLWYFLYPGTKHIVLWRGRGQVNKIKMGKIVKILILGGGYVYTCVSTISFIFYIPTVNVIIFNWGFFYILLKMLGGANFIIFLFSIWKSKNEIKWLISNLAPNRCAPQQEKKLRRPRFFKNSKAVFAIAKSNNRLFILP